MRNPTPGHLPNPLHRVRRVHCDAHGAREWMRRVCGPHELIVEAGRPLAFEHAGDTLGPMSTVIGCVGYGADVAVRIDGQAPLDCYSVSLPLVGEQELVAGGRRLRSDAETGLVVAPALRQELRISGDCRKLLVAIDRQALRGTLEDMLGHRVAGDVVFEPRLSLQQGEAVSWWRMVRMLWDDLGQPGRLFSHQALSGGLEDALIRGLLAFQPHSHSAELLARAGGDVPPHVAAMRSFLVGHAREDLRAEDLAGVGGVSAARMATDFQRHMGLTPLQFLRRHRLEQARRLLVQVANTRSVSEVAMEWGFTHLGRFSQAYRDAFGEAPSATALRHRQRRLVR